MAKPHGYSETNGEATSESKDINGEATSESKDINGEASRPVKTLMAKPHGQ